MNGDFLCAEMTCQLYHGEMVEGSAGSGRWLTPGI